MQKAQIALTTLACVGILVLVGLSVSSQSSLATALKDSQQARADAEGARAQRDAALVGSFQDASTSMAALAKALSEPRPVQVENKADAAEAAIMLSNLTDNQCRNYAAYILGRLGGEKAEARLIEMAKNDPDTSASQAAFQALQTMRSPVALVIAMEKLRSNDLNQKQMAASVLSNLATSPMVPEIAKELTSLKGRDNNVEQIRYYLYRVFERLGDSRACTAILVGLSQEDEPYRRSQGIEALMACASAAYTEDILAMLESIDLMNNNHSGAWSEFMRGAARVGDPRYAPMMVKFVTHNSSSYRRMALDGLRRMQDPESAKELLEAWKKATGSTKTEIQKLLTDGYAGIVSSEDGTEFTLAGADEMKKLVAERDAQIAELLKREKAIANVGGEDGGKQPGGGGIF